MKRGKVACRDGKGQLGMKGMQEIPNCRGERKMCGMQG